MTAGRTNSDQLSVHWCTPTKYVNAVRKALDGTIHLDPCSNDDSIVGASVEYKLPDMDGLLASWNFPSIFVNPPYGSDKERGTRISDWLARCDEAHTSFGSEVIALIPVAVNTGHWKRHIWGKADAICFCADTRLKFRINGREDGKGAPMACCVVYWGNNIRSFEAAFLDLGAIVFLENQKGNRRPRKGPPSK